MYYVGIDGEGQGKANHRYVMFACASEDGSHTDIIESAQDERLTTVDCLEFILRQPSRAQLFAYAFNYDLTKILTDVDDRELYYLFRPELRRSKNPKLPPRSVQWNGYSLNLVGTKFSVRRGKVTRIIWDVFRFFQSKFTKALIDWKVADEGGLIEMEKMKGQRSNFDQLDRESIRKYCLDECKQMATLARKLTEAHDVAGLKLRSYFGAGSTASAMLNQLLIHKEKRIADDVPAEAIAQAFFGGRFENSIIGSVREDVWSYDISSAYPYQITQMPCLSCCEWQHVKEEDDLTSTIALVRYQLDDIGNEPWGPFPFRTSDGCITFPRQSGGGWIWSQEYSEGKSLWYGDKVKFIKAWQLIPQCDHKPFSKIPEWYLERLKLGKEGPGIVLKLGMNSCYGKLAQSIGKPKFQSWIWAGMITSNTRAQILHMLRLHSNPFNLLMIATDGIYSREKIVPPRPIDTGTLTEHNKPLGGWECKPVKGGVFAARPGIYFPLETEEGNVRARGVGRNVLFECRDMIIDAFSRGELSIKLKDGIRFHGAKSSLSIRNAKADNPEFIRSALYGQWSKRPIEMTFRPMPKREAVKHDGTLALRSFSLDTESLPYSRSLLSPERFLMMMMKDEMLEQSEGDDWTGYEELDFI